MAFGSCHLNIARNDSTCLLPQIKHGSSLTVRAENGLTPLASAVLKTKRQHIDVILNHFEAGSEDLKRLVNIRSKVFTPLMIAAAKADWAIFSRLLDAGADPNAVTRSGLTKWFSFPKSILYCLDSFHSMGFRTAKTRRCNSSRLGFY